MTSHTNSSDFYQEITNQIIEALEQGVKPWVCPWDITVSSGLPQNLSTQSYYQGMNIMLLWMSAMKQQFSSSQWVTFKQAKGLGGNIRKGEKGTRIFFYKMVKKKEAVDEDDVYPMLKTYTVFNCDQVDGLSPSVEVEETPARTEIEVIDEVESFINSTKAAISWTGQRAFFRPSTDEIVLPSRERFHRTADCYATVLHELTHWTGHSTRLNREMTGQFGSKDYAFEELCAELGSAFLMSDLGIVGEVQHDSYISSWLEALRNDKRYVFKAASKASQAHAFLRELVEKNQLAPVLDMTL